MLYHNEAEHDSEKHEVPHTHTDLWGSTLQGHAHECLVPPKSVGGTHRSRRQWQPVGVGTSPADSVGVCRWGGAPALSGGHVYPCALPTSCLWPCP